MSARTSKIHRKTRETDISISLDIDGSGRYDVECDDQFLKHMTETLARYSGMDITMLDIVDRPYCEADCPDPLYAHWFRSFAMSAGITLHILVVRGFDDHHIVEASFKSMGKALQTATHVRGEELSTKDRVEVD